MTLTSWPETIAQFHAGGWQAVLALAGGGVAVSEILEVPGASRFLLEARVPYARRAVDEFLGSRPEDYASPRAACSLAMAAFQRAMQLSADAEGIVAEETARRLLGVGCAASLVSDRPKRGPHRVHAAVQTAEQTLLVSLVLNKGERNRPEEEAVAACLVLSAIAEVLGIASSAPLLLRENEMLERTVAAATADERDLLLGAVDAICLESTDAEEPEPPEEAPPVGLLFPGSFHPLHEGHRRMAEFAAARFGGTVEFEISIENVEKPPLDFLEMHARAEQFAHAPLWLTRAPTFREKARIFPGAVFLVGLDTLERIAEPRFYESPEDRDAAIAELARLGCRFLVFGRRVGEAFQTLAECPLPPALAELCDAVSEAEFRCDVSSTELRGG